MSKRLLLVSGGGNQPVGPLPPDPTLTAERQVTQLTGTTQNTVTLPTGPGRTYRMEQRIGTDFTTLRLAFGSFAQGALDVPWTATTTIEKQDGTIVPMTWGGEPSLSCGEAESVESDEVAGLGYEGAKLFVRLYAPGGTRMPVGRSSLPVTYMAGDHTTGAWTPVDDPAGDPQGPLPLAIIGKARPSTVCPAMIGDSIAAIGIEVGGWWREVVGLNPALSYGRNARRFGSTDGREGDTLRAATHVIVEYGANDFAASPAVSFVWGQAVPTYAYIDAQNPGIPIWQTTCLPLVQTTDNCATLENQTPFGVSRLDWNVFLRDGAPCHPDTLAALAPGATGLRVGQEGHPLAGVLDIAAEVEEGGSSAPTGRWLPGDPANAQLGSGWGGDGVHPSNEGARQMKTPLDTWYAQLTT